MIPQRCEACDRYCDGCSFSKVYPPRDSPLDAAEGIIFGAMIGLAAWLIFAVCVVLVVRYA